MDSFTFASSWVPSFEEMRHMTTQLQNLPLIHAGGWVLAEADEDEVG